MKEDLKHFKNSLCPHISPEDSTTKRVVQVAHNEEAMKAPGKGNTQK